MADVLKLEKVSIGASSECVLNFFGESEAEVEWKNDEKKSANLFLHTDAYEQFSKPEVLFMFGRRGTGKTAILRMSKYSINNNKYKLFPYTSAETIEEHEAFYEMAFNARNSPIVESPIEELEHFFLKQWKWIVNSTALKSLYDKHVDIAESDDRISKIGKYLENHNLMENKRKPLYKISSILEDCVTQVGSEYLKLAAVFNRALKLITGVDYDEAIEAMRSFLKETNSYTLVMLDSIEDFRHDDKIVKSILSASIRAAWDFNLEKAENRIIFKIAFPTEMHSKIRKWHRDKVDNRLIFITWKYSKLVTMMAKRFCYKFDGGDINDCISKYSDYQAAKIFIYTFIPSEIETRHGFKLDTLAYIVRHTQKRPRQLINLFNAIYTYADDQKDDLEMLSQESIRMGTHSRLDLVVAGTIGIFDKIYEGSETLLRRLFTDKNAVFSYNELHSYISEVSHIKKSLNMVNSDIENFLLETGLIGIVTQSRVSKKIWCFMA
jgi:hypothetical protein